MSGIFKGSTNGVLGAPMASGPGNAIRDGSLGAPMEQGGGYAYNDGSLGRFRLPRIFPRRHMSGLGCATCGLKGLGETSVAVPTTLILGALIGAAAVYWMMGEKQTRAAA
jgi:hypothetical protein